ncbi:MAG: class I SAM-dependent methyltransferase [Anaerolineales bacterium]|nr:class I SAM-dependent methyltransferase [Anaerolineales bacterium]
MKPNEFELLYKSEDRHWWYLGMAEISKSLLNRWYSAGAKLQILDAGCGAGAAMATFLSEYGRVTGFDLSSNALNYCHIREIDNIVCASAINIPFQPKTFDLVSSFDVLSDIGVSDDVTPIKEFFRVLVNGGRLILRLPAYSWLISHHDDAVQTVRRYSAKQIALLLTQSGFIVEHLSYANTLLFPFALLYRLIGKFNRYEPGKPSDLSIDFKCINQFLKMILKLEAIPVTTIGLPYGLSLFVVGRKP